MARYVTLIRFTEQGARDVRKSVARAEAFKKSAGKAGVNVDAMLWTAGSYDGVLVLSGDEKKVLHSLCDLAAQGNVRTETLQAFEAGEFSSING